MTRYNLCIGIERFSRRVGLGSGALLAAILAAMASPAALAQSAAPTRQPASVELAVPTTKVLAIGSFTAKATPDIWLPIIPAEMRATARLYLAGKIDQWYVKPDQSGVVFIMNLDNPEAAHELLEKLPLGQAGLMSFQLIPLGPLSPLRMLLGEPAKP